jgi:hypothetical protein
MFGMDKKKMRLMAMDKMMKDKPALSGKVPSKMMPEMEMEESEEPGAKVAYVSMPVTEEEKAMILKMRQGAGMGEMEEAPEEAAY